VAPNGPYKNEFGVSAGVSKLLFATVCPEESETVPSHIAADAINAAARFIAVFI